MIMIMIMILIIITISILIILIIVTITGIRPRHDRRSYRLAEGEWMEALASYHI